MTSALMNRPGSRSAPNNDDFPHQLQPPTIVQIDRRRSASLSGLDGNGTTILPWNHSLAMPTRELADYPVAVVHTQVTGG
jgi:hypothetical protein